MNNEKIIPHFFANQPHDKYARFALRIRVVMLELLQYCVPNDVMKIIDPESLELSDDTFIDEKLRMHFSDICYNGKTADKQPIRITVLLEHKSTIPDYPLYAQLHKYIANIWNKDYRQNKKLSLVLPVVVYNGSSLYEKDTPLRLFPNAEPDLLSYVPNFDYILLDLSQVSSEELEGLKFLFLRNFLLALKNSRDNAYIEKSWKKIIIFASEVKGSDLANELFTATFFIFFTVLNHLNKNSKTWKTHTHNPN